MFWNSRKNDSNEAKTVVGVKIYQWGGEAIRNKNKKHALAYAA
jgi:hypothetical protein